MKAIVYNGPRDVEERTRWRARVSSPSITANSGPKVCEWGPDRPMSKTTIATCAG